MTTSGADGGATYFLAYTTAGANLWKISFDDHAEQVFDFDIVHLKKGGAKEVSRWAVAHRIRDIEQAPDGSLWALEDEIPAKVGENHKRFHFYFRKGRVGLFY